MEITVLLIIGLIIVVGSIIYFSEQVETEQKHTKRTHPAGLFCQHLLATQAELIDIIDDSGIRHNNKDYRDTLFLETGTLAFAICEIPILTMVRDMSKVDKFLSNEFTIWLDYLFNKTQFINNDKNVQMTQEKIGNYSEYLGHYFKNNSKQGENNMNEIYKLYNYFMNNCIRLGLCNENLFLAHDSDTFYAINAFDQMPEIERRVHFSSVCINVPEIIYSDKKTIHLMSQL